MSDPVLQAFLIQAQPDILATGNGVEEANPFDTATVTPVAAVGNDYGVEGALLSAAARQTDGNHALANTS